MIRALSKETHFNASKEEGGEEDGPPQALKQFRAVTRVSALTKPTIPRVPYAEGFWFYRTRKGSGLRKEQRSLFADNAGMRFKGLNALAYPQCRDG